MLVICLTQFHLIIEQLFQKLLQFWSNSAFAFELLHYHLSGSYILSRRKNKFKSEEREHRTFCLSNIGLLKHEQFRYLLRCVYLRGSTCVGLLCLIDTHVVHSSFLIWNLCFCLGRFLSKHNIAVSNHRWKWSWKTRP